VTERVLVTGGAGFIGSHLVDALLARGDTVRVLDSLLEQAHPSGRARFLSPDAELVVGDLRDRATVDRVLRDVTAVFHQAGMVGNGQSMYDVRRYVEVNVVGTATLLEAMLARRDQFRRLVVASSMVVYGDGAYRCPVHDRVAGVIRPLERLRRGAWEPICPRCGEEVTPVATPEDHPREPTSTYAISKRDQEELALVLGRAHGLPTVVLRYLNTYGSRQALGNPYTGVAAIIATRLLNGRPPLIFEDGRQRRDFVHVRDVAAANLAALQALALADVPSGGVRAYNIASGNPRTVRDMATALATAMDGPPPVVTGQFRPGDVRHVVASPARAREELRFTASVPFEEGVAEFAHAPLRT
jgi:dTDP-L-rhamnose 4-epimerase